MSSWTGDQHMHSPGRLQNWIGHGQAELIQCDTQKFNYRVPTLLITKNSRTFQDHQNVFPGPSRSAIPGCKAYGTPNILKFVIIVVYFEPPVNSSTIEDHFPVLSRTLSFHFQDFPGPGKSRTFQDVWEPCQYFKYSSLSNRCIWVCFLAGFGSWTRSSKMATEIRLV